MTATPDVIVLAGGPDPERDVSIQSARGVADALRAAGLDVHERVIDAISAAELAELPGAVVFPVLHGPWGEGGPMQDLLEAGGRPYVGSGPAAARLAMDKLATKLAAANLGIPTAPAAVFGVRDTEPPIELPVVVKPVRDGSSKGVRLIRERSEWDAAWRELSSQDRLPAHMVERLITGRELTVGLLDRGEGLVTLPLVEIAPAEGPYDYAAKYDRDDTVYTVRPELPANIAEQASAYALGLGRALGVRDLARVDFLLDTDGGLWLLEANTMPGFTSHSLLPMAARASGIEMPDLCAGLIESARRRNATPLETH